MRMFGQVTYVIVKTWDFPLRKMGAMEGPEQRGNIIRLL